VGTGGLSARISDRAHGLRKIKEDRQARYREKLQSRKRSSQDGKRQPPAHLQEEDKKLGRPDPRFCLQRVEKTNSSRQKNEGTNPSRPQAGNESKEYHKEAQRSASLKEKRSYPDDID